MPVIQKSVEQLGFKFSDIKILLGNHAHGDHQEGDALVKQLTGAQVMAMAEDVPALQAIKPGGKEHPIDRVLHDGEQVTLGGTTLVAHLTPGHTRGCTTWTMKAQEAGKTYNVVFGCSLARTRAGSPPANVDEFTRSFKLVRALPCDVQLGDHGAQYNMQAKYARLRSGGAEPVHRSGHLQARSGDLGGDVPRHPGGAAEIARALLYLKNDFASEACTPLVASTACVTCRSAASAHRM